MQWFLIAISVAGGAGLGALAPAARLRFETARLRAQNAALEARLGVPSPEPGRRAAGVETQAWRRALADQARAVFLAALDDEFRAPLNTIVGFCEVLRRDAGAPPLTPTQSEALDRIASAGARLLNRMEQLLDLSRVEAGSAHLSVERVDPALVAREACDSLQAEARAAGITLIPPPRQPGPGALADRDRLRQVLLHLVSEALRRSRPGDAVRLEVARRSGCAVVSVVEAGDGARRDGAGAELDLALSRRLAEAMGGRLETAAHAATEAAFSLILPGASPALAARTRRPPAQTAGPLPRAVVLYVEDDPAQVALMRHLARALGPVRLYVAVAIPEAVALARDLRPDAVLAALAPPALDGAALGRALRADPRTRATPLLALAPPGAPGDAPEPLEGFAAVLSRPLHAPALAEALGRAIDMSRARSGRPAFRLPA